MMPANISKPASSPLSERRWAEMSLPPEQMDKYGLHDVTPTEAESLGYTNTSAGIMIPYYDMTTKQLIPSANRVRFYRSGFSAQTKAGKYGQLPNTPPRAYVAPTVDAHLLKSKCPVIIVEGEFKAIYLTELARKLKLELLPIGLGGVHSFKSNKMGWDLLPELQQDISWLSRPVYIAYDMDQEVNPHVQAALASLVDTLAPLVNTACNVLQWDKEQGKGIDDYLLNSISPSSELLTLLANARPTTLALKVLNLNERFAYSEQDQKIYDAGHRMFVPPTNFTKEYFTEIVRYTVPGAPGKGERRVAETLGAYWLASPLRTTISGVRFMPGSAKSSDRYANSWQGWGVGQRQMKGITPCQGDVRPFLKFLEAAFGKESRSDASKDEDTPTAYLIKRLAWIFQQPQKKHPSWLYIIGKPRMGKTTLIGLISKLIGMSYVNNIDENTMKSAFTEWYTDKLLVTLDDTVISDKRTVRQLLKRLTTEDQSWVNKKHQQGYTTENFANFMFATNSIEGLIDHDDRRALVLEANVEWSYPSAEWSEFDDWCDHPNSLPALLHYFQYEVKLDASFFKSHPPHTSSRALVIDSGLTAWDTFIYDWCCHTAPISWRNMHENKMKHLKPTIFTAEDVKRVFELIEGPNVTTHDIKIVSLASKLQRFGAQKCQPTNHTDSRGRLSVNGKQTILWTTDNTWVRRTGEEYQKEYMRLHKEYPEVFMVQGAVPKY